MISQKIKATIHSKTSSVIRQMFEEGIRLKKLYGQDKVFDFSLGNPDLEPPPQLKEEIIKQAKNDFHGCHGYMSNAGFPETRKAIAEKVSLEQNFQVESKNVVISCGAASALNCIFKTLLNEGDEVIVPSPFFSEYRNYVGNYNGKLVEVPSKDDFSLEIQAIKDALSPKTAAILINTPNNPTGKVYSQKEIEDLVFILDEYSKNSERKPYLIFDEPYRAIVYDGVTIPTVFDKYNYSIIISSFAKDLSIPGERIGYMAVNPNCDEADEVVNAFTFCLRTLGFVNAPAFFQRVISKTWNAKVDYSSYKKRRDLLMAILDEAGFEYFRPDGAFYLFVKVPDFWKGDDGAFCEHLKKFFILSAPGIGFGKKGFFRLAYCVSEKTIINSREAFINAAK
ncbi:pyridoxal phosphate-dependent aminotransferase [Treponema pectinovorum]|uniref:pyridoxal phosphate-dependent aminotransferase n=1 Tax=Treponema pectinovorum TaxID=164 RepID=UPI0011CA90CB|nr:pyridoxal phosphate-dependent aminotransferase [Treponema pectinovorum]